LQTAALGYESVIVAGPDLEPKTAQRLSTMASMIQNVQWINFTPCLPCELKYADLVVCMGGYNTLCEVLLHRRHALVLPRTTPRLEQTLRADLWEQRGAVSVIPPQRLSPELLAQLVAERLEQGTSPVNVELDLNGLSRIRKRVGQWLQNGVNDAVALPVQ